jgi:hypothetical protein
MEFTINVKQGIAMVWTFVAAVLSLIITIAMGWPTSTYGTIFSAAWEWLVVLFFGVFLILTIPVYLLIALWHIVSKSDVT